MTEEQIREVFGLYGEVVKVDIKRDKLTNNNLGYGFVQYKVRHLFLVLFFLRERPLCSLVFPRNVVHSNFHS